jgi:hypothetical protein
VIKFLRLPVLVATVAALAIGASTAASAANPTNTGPLTIPITPAQSGGLLDGVFTLTNVTTNAQNQLIGNGTFTGLANGQTVTATPASAPITSQQQGGSCTILDLTVNPIHLDLLGLVVDLQAVHLTITAERGPGNLLGNLLCALAGLLDNGLPGPLGLVNRVNTILGG